MTIVTPEFINLFTSTMTAFVLVSALFLGVRFLKNYEQNQKLAREQAQMTFASSQAGGLHFSATSSSVGRDPTEGGGYDFVQVPDEFKPIFLDAMNGFCDYAKLKGYHVELSTESSQPGKVGMKITIVDIGVTVSTTTVRKDVHEYMRKLKDDDDFSDMPMPENAAEHMIIVSALRARFSYVKTQLEMHKIKADLLEGLLIGVKNSGLGAITYPVPQSQLLQVTVQNDGGKNMGDSYKATNSQNIAQGKGASAYTSDSNIQIGNNHSERNQRIEALKDFVKQVEAENLPKEIKGEVVRYIENARDELETAANPNSNEVGKWLERANKTITTAAAGAGLVEKLAGLLTKFGVN